MQSLVGRPLPSIPLKSTSGEWVNPALVGGLAVYFCYPYTGKPGVPDPEGWDDIPGAHGSTPQASAYSKSYSEFRQLGVSLFGLSLQTADWQLEAVQRLSLQVPLLSDENGLFTTAMRLPLFKAGERNFIRRTTLLVRDATVVGVHAPSEPEKDAEQVLALVRKK